MKRNIFYSLGLLIIFSITFSGCFNDLDLEPKYGLNSSSVYNNPDNYINVLAKLYAGLSMTGNQGPAGDPDITGIDEGYSSYIRVMWNLQEVPTDEAIVGWNDPGLPELNTMDWVATNPWPGAMYYRIFFQVTMCNEFIRETSQEKLENRDFSQADIDRITQYRKEARFLRALSYYHALDFFGDAVPFVTTEDKVGAFLPEPTTRQELFDYIESELLAIEADMLDPVVGFDSEYYARANKAVVWTLLAKLYLNAEVLVGESHWQDCKTYCQRVIDAGYSLDADYKDLFQADNQNTTGIIFPVTFDGMQSQTFGGTTFLTHGPIGGSMNPDNFGVNDGWAGYRSTKNLVHNFDNLIFEDDLADGKEEWEPLGSGWDYSTDNERLEFESVAGAYPTHGAEPNATLENNRTIEVTFSIGGFNRFIDTTVIDSTFDGGYLAIGDGTTPSDTFRFNSNGSYSVNFNTGNADDIRFYGQNCSYRLDNVNIVYRDGDSRFLFHVEGQGLDIDEVGTFTDGFAVAKWSNVDDEGNPGVDPTGTYVDTDFPFFRLADVYLMYAEAAARSGSNMDQGEDYLNLVRERAGAPTVSSYDAEFVLAERSRELYFEGYRRTDLIRYDRYTGSNYLWPWKGGEQEGQAVEDYRQLYPLPQSDLSANPNLTQNEGYSN